MLNITKQPLFTIPLIRVKFPDHHLLNADDEIREFFNNTDTLYSNNLKETIGNYQSTTTIETPVNAFSFNGLKPLTDWVKSIQQQLWESLDFDPSILAIERSWVNRLVKSDIDTPTHMFAHVHGSTDLVCTYYYRCPPGSATIRFYNPLEMPIGIAPQNKPNVSIQPVEGELLAWPGYLWHSVDNHYLEQERIIAGFHINQQSFSINPRFVRAVYNPSN